MRLHKVNTKDNGTQSKIRVHKAYLRSLFNQTNKPVKLMCVKARQEIIDRRWNELIEYKIQQQAT